MEKNAAYDVILNKISEMRTNFPVLRKKTDDFVFSALCLKNTFFKNPVLNFTEDIILESIVDGRADGGVDILINDPNVETNDLVICQSKFYENISYDDVADAIHKMIDFYKNMDNGNYEAVNQTVQKRFLTLNSEIGDESKIVFVFYTSASKNSIRIDRLNKIVKEEFKNDNKFELQVYFAKDLENEIKEAESRRPYVETGELIIDQPDNCLEYQEQAAICNISAYSLKTLYAIHSTDLLARNLRYYIKKKDIDDSINDTIKTSSETFWFKNNGITIICKDFVISGRRLKLQDFSIVNGGQTTTLIYKSDKVSKDVDFYLPCKVIRIVGDTEDEKNQFSLEISKATNSQKAIKNIDLKANSPEQVRFANSMREAGVFYQTKRGETIPKDYKLDYLNSDLASVGKLCLAGIFQLPATSRSKPSILYTEQFYNPIFNGDQKSVCGIARDMLYVDYFFRKKFIPEFDVQNKNPNMIPFAHNSRTICLAFVGLAARYCRKTIKINDFLNKLDHSEKDKFYEEYLYDLFKELNGLDSIFNYDIYKSNKDEIDKGLYILFAKLINEGFKNYSMAKKQNSQKISNETNYLKNDKNYFDIIFNSWNDFVAVFEENSNLFVK